jgi:hypothetical protein
METKTNFFLGVTVAMTIGLMLQIFGTIRYMGRHPDDPVGKVLFITTSVLFVFITCGYYLQW